MRKKKKNIKNTEAAVSGLLLLKKEKNTAKTHTVPPVKPSAPLPRGRYDEDEIGSRMSDNFIAIPAGATIKGAMTKLIREAAEKDNISTLFAVDDAGVFRGGIDLKDLIVAREDTPLAEITDAAYPVVYANATVEECVPRLVGYSEASVPVLDAGGRLAGVLISQEFLRVMREEYGEDYAMLAGLPAEEDLSEPVRKSVRKRIPWLVVLLFIGLFVSATVGIFESVVAQLPVIMCFQSLILDMAGNVGTQSLAVAIRMLTGQKPGKWKAELVWKETRVGFFNGVLLGAFSFLAIGGYLCLKRYPAPFAFAVSGCLAAAMVLAMVASSLSGTLIPMFFRKIGVDPAVASGPLITTINDLVAVVSYYGLAWLILIRWLHLA